MALSEAKTKQLSDQFITRPVTFDDAEAVTELMNIYERNIVGVAGNRPERIRNDWQSPGFNIDTHTTLVITPEGEFVGYGSVWNTNSPYVSAWTWGAVHPDYEGQGIGAYLMNWYEERCCQDVEKAPPNARVIAMIEAFHTHQKAADLYVQHGWKLIRHGLRMVIDIENNDIPSPSFPDGITIRAFKHGEDDEATYRAFDVSFRDHWGHVDVPFEEGFKDFNHWYEKDDKWDPSVWFLAMDGDEIAGVSLCKNEFDGEPDMAYVSILGIRRPWRRKGLALALLQHTFTEFKKRGRKKVSLHVDAFSLTRATKLYEKAGMHKDHQWDIYEKVLREGEDLTTQSV